MGFLLDIEKMFLNVKLNEEDKKYCLVWIFHQGEWKIMQFESHLFGKRDSPNLVMFCVHKAAAMMFDQCPKASKFLQSYTIMDDLLANANDSKECLQTIQDVQNILGLLNMKCHKIICSDENVLKALGEEKVHKKIEFVSHGDGEDKEEGVKYNKLKTLGLNWDGEKDQFYYEFFLPEVEKWTKRLILGTYAKIFDPCGFLLPFVITGRLAFQASCLESQDWDAKIEEEGESSKLWKNFLNGLGKLGEIQIQRIIRSQKEENVMKRQIHIFSDASKNAMGACAYLATFYKNGESESHLIMAKANVAPTLQKSLPRLELAAAEIATRMTEIIHKFTGIPSLNFNYWSDSYNVLYWILQQSRALPVFEANRVSKIQCLSNIKNWKHVPGHLNPADLITRPVDPKILQNSQNWWHGPEFILTEEYPPQKINPSLINEEAYSKRIKIFNLNLRIKEDSFGEFEKRFNAFAQVLQVVWNLKKWRNPELNKFGLGLRRRFTFAEICKYIQRQCYGEEIAVLEEGKQLHFQHHLVELKPFLDEDGVLRGESRFSFADNLSWEEKNPVILHHQHPFTKLLVDEKHKKFLNCTGGTGTLMSAIRKTGEAIWIPRGRRMLNCVIRECINCRRYDPKPAPQEMGKLPNYRIDEDFTVFSTCGIDCFGPYVVERAILKDEEKKKKVLEEELRRRNISKDDPDYKPARKEKDETRYSKKIKDVLNSLNQNKVWVVIFTCAVSRAIHLEVIDSMDIRAIYLAIQRFVAIRRYPKRFVSDQGTNFRGLVNLLKEMKSRREYQNHFKAQAPDLQWEFNTPLSPHQGGFWERLIKEAKRAIHKSTSTYEMDFEIFRTMIKGVENLLNNRPLINQFDFNDRIITPNDILKCKIDNLDIQAAAGKYPKEIDKYNEIMRFIWEEIVDYSLKRNSTLRKWRQENPKFQNGEVVIIVGKTNEYGKYPIGLIVEEDPSKDDIQRKVKVKIPSGEILERGVHDLYRLNKPEIESVKCHSLYIDVLEQNWDH